jgi:hypothetical protein
MGAFHQHTYLGGQACINLYLENITGLELVYWPENTSIRDPSTWMSFARYPDPSVNCNGYSSIKTIVSNDGCDYASRATEYVSS